MEYTYIDEGGFVHKSSVDIVSELENVNLSNEYYLGSVDGTPGKIAFCAPVGMIGKKNIDMDQLIIQDVLQIPRRGDK